MSIHIILGKPGSGKSFYATRRLIDELCDTNRNIVTNLPLRLDALNDYVQKRWPDRDLRPLQRIRLLSDDEMRYFWKFRGAADVAPPELQLWGAEQNEQRKSALARDLDHWAKTPSLGDEGRGVAYFLDEAHIPFNARAWATVATAALFYLSQHRKLGDIVWPITQAPSNLDKQFRSVAEDFTRVRNEYLAKWGPFKGRGRFVRKTYLSEPTGTNAEPFETASFTLDGIEACYDTAKGIGVHGNKADVGRRANGIPILWVVPGALVLALACVVVPYLIGKGAAKFIGGSEAVPAASKASALTADKPTAVLPPTAAPMPVKRKETSLTYSATAYGRRGVRVWLSDGRVLENGDGVLRSIGTNTVTLFDGSVLHRTPVRPSSPLASPRVVDAALVSPPQRIGPEPEAKTSSSEYRGEALFAPSADVAKLPAVSAQQQKQKGAVGPRSGTAAP